MSATDHPPPSLAADEEAFRAHLDAHGILRAGSLAPPDRSASFAVFAQRNDATLPLEPLKRQALQFFRTRFGLSVDKEYGDEPLLEDAARMVVAGEDATARGTRLVYGRPARPEDVEAAENAERATGASASGLSLLARRCRMVWLVVPSAGDDRAAVTISAILASVLLGPILAPGSERIFGVRTARLDLERTAHPYR